VKVKVKVPPSMSLFTFISLLLNQVTTTVLKKGGRDSNVHRSWRSLTFVLHF